MRTTRKILAWRRRRDIAKQMRRVGRAVKLVATTYNVAMNAQMQKATAACIAFGRALATIDTRMGAKP